MKVIKPKCPNCKKVMQDALDGKGWYTCPRCKLEFTIDTKSEYKSYKSEVLSQTA